MSQDIITRKQKDSINNVTPLGILSSSIPFNFYYYWKGSDVVEIGGTSDLAVLAKDKRRRTHCYWHARWLPQQCSSLEEGEWHWNDYQHLLSHSPSTSTTTASSEPTPVGLSSSSVLVGEVAARADIRHGHGGLPRTNTAEGGISSWVVEVMDDEAACRQRRQPSSWMLS